MAIAGQRSAAGSSRVLGGVSAGARELMPRRRASHVPALVRADPHRRRDSVDSRKLPAFRVRRVAAELLSLATVAVAHPIVFWRLLAPASERVYIPDGDLYSQYLPL